ncbi:MAG: hypothetical protein V4621_07760 [Pseudomonadota bacterium]
MNLRIWTVFKHPDDFPTRFVGRLSVVSVKDNKPLISITDGIVFGSNAEEVAELVEIAENRILHFVSRAPEDEPAIIGCWL